jgi:hypothetical protein
MPQIKPCLNTITRSKTFLLQTQENHSFGAANRINSKQDTERPLEQVVVTNTPPAPIQPITQRAEGGHLREEQVDVPWSV